MHGPPKMVDVMADMIQKGASAAQAVRTVRGRWATLLRTWRHTWAWKLGLENLDSNFKGMARVLLMKNQAGEEKRIEHRTSFEYQHRHVHAILHGV